MITTLTKRIQTILLPFIMERDNEGFVCWYCKKPLFFFKYIFEHLDDDRTHNEFENFVISCSSCNKRKVDDAEMKQRAFQKLDQNKNSDYLRERKHLIDELTTEASPEIEINIACTDITKQFITEKVESDGFILKSEALYCSVYLCREKTGHGSTQSCREYIKILTCEVAPFKIVRDENNRKIIVKRCN